MPKVRDTRKQRAAKLARLLTEGPSFSEPFYTGEAFTAKLATQQYKNWSRSWVLAELFELVPELRKQPELFPYKDYAAHQIGGSR
jgi:hypothetical protein